MPRNAIRVCLSVAMHAACLAAVLAADNPARVSFELATEPGLPVAASQQWYKLLTELGVDSLQIRQGRRGEEASIAQGARAASSFRVTGILKSDNTLHVPGGRFRTSDRAKLRQWLETLSDQGADGVTQPVGAFGLHAGQLQAVNADFARPVAIATATMPAAQAIARIASGLSHPLEVDAAANRALSSATVADELRGISSGTALAAICRPAGLALVPGRIAGGKLQYRIVEARAGQEAWPIGRKPTERPPELLPALFESLDVEIKDTPVSEAVAAVQGRLGVPVLFDHNALAAYGVDPAAVLADVPGKRLTYSQILGAVLSQAKLKYELRVDEAEKPLLWITSVRVRS